MRSQRRWLHSNAPATAPDIIIEAFSLLAPDYPDLRLGIVGHIPDQFAPTIDGLIGNNSLTDRVVVTSRVDPDEYASWLERTDVAVQLRRATNREVLAAVGDCLRFGTPTIVTALGPAADLPNTVVTKVPPDTDLSALAAFIRGLISDSTSRSRFSTDAHTYIEERSFDAIGPVF